MTDLRASEERARRLLAEAEAICSDRAYAALSELPETVSNSATDPIDGQTQKPRVEVLYEKLVALRQIAESVQDGQRDSVPSLRASILKVDEYLKLK
jgi:hypothetical protein